MDTPPPPPHPPHPPRPYTSSRWHYPVTGFLSVAGFGCGVWVTCWMAWRVAQDQRQDTADSVLYAFAMAIIPFCVMFVLDGTRRPGDSPRLGGFVGRLLLTGLLASYGWGVTDLFLDRGVEVKDAIIGGVIFAGVAFLGPWMLSQWLVTWFRRNDPRPGTDNESAGE